MLDESNHLRDALKFCATIVSELRTSSLSPKSYYQLYSGLLPDACKWDNMSIFQELQYFSAFLSDPNRRQRQISELYENVQHAGSILPRLYLLITVGACYIKSLETPATDILRDLTELCKGVQHPIRGLFLRYYLAQMCKDKLPDTGSIYEEAHGGTLDDAFDLLFSNFTECANLWVRLQSQCPMREKQRREEERYDLRVLVGANLVCMAQLEGMTCEYYSQVALPKLLEYILGCNDTLGQQYLFDCLIQVFSDECHIQTLEVLLSSFLEALPSVDLKPVLANLMGRLRSFIVADPSVVHENVKIFELFQNNLKELMKQPLAPHPSVSNGSFSRAETGATSLTLQTILDLQLAFLNFTLAIYPGQVKYVDIILESTVEFLDATLGPKGKLQDEEISSAVELLCVPLKHLSLSILEMDHFPNLMDRLSFPTRKKVAISMVDAVLTANSKLDDIHAVTRLFSFISPLIEDSKENIEIDDENEFAVQQAKVAKLIHAIQHEDTDCCYEMYQAAYQQFAKGGPKRLKFTSPALVYCSLKLIRAIWQREDQLEAGVNMQPAIISPKKALQFVHRLCTDLTNSDPEVGVDHKIHCVMFFDCLRFNMKNTETHLYSLELKSMALRLFLHCAIISNDAEMRENRKNFEPICYEFLSQAFVCYEDEISDSRNQRKAITLLVGTLISCVRCLDQDNYFNLATKVTLHSSKLLKKYDQCNAILQCCHLFWNSEYIREGRRVLECLQKCLKIADSSLQSTTPLIQTFVDILDKYIYFYDENNTEITVEFIRNLVALCAEHIKYAETDKDDAASLHFRNTLESLKLKAAKDTTSRYRDLSLEEIQV
ncbi:putative vacuolar sorting protein 35 [Cardiosporidium cionae]|uniref:Vacuolar protein sorting-associated protein 35 n=1 Tax=Cardiosporidium cionae TaxID=476202 RepID=A0ABQ7J913_9APIC|nr:putative vacuolar sorting protein 35 [Cardiosporidium cionae]|eukprot:KAF8820472.1 putative vacuolar sorting protein 35 [Cardiosporidium cionae]